MSLLSKLIGATPKRGFLPCDESSCDLFNGAAPRGGSLAARGRPGLIADCSYRIVSVNEMTAMVTSVGVHSSAFIAVVSKSTPTRHCDDHRRGDHSDSAPSGGVGLVSHALSQLRASHRSGLPDSRTIFSTSCSSSHRKHAWAFTGDLPRAT